MTREEAIAAGVEVYETQHSMKRRTPWHDYSRKGTYMLTLVLKERMALLGALKGCLEGEVAPYVEYSALGRAIIHEEQKKINQLREAVDAYRVAVARARAEESAATSTSNETEGNPKKNSYRSIVNYILWRFPRLKNKHNEEMLRIMYGHIPQKLLADDNTYSGLITLETNRIIKYGNNNPYPFDDEIGVLVEFSKLSYQLAMKHIKNRRLLMCSKAMIYTVRNIQYRLSDGDKVRTNELINEMIADFQYAGGNYSVISNRLRKILRQ